ncbi:MAG: hypothetical protein JWO82_2816 [Akkermansiaceae bacterium]|nr:hypothetical protein [Akkermansiaceae bacterium]
MRSSRSKWRVAILFAVSLAVWFYDRHQKQGADGGGPAPKAIPVQEGSGASTGSSSQKEPSKAGRYEKYEGCLLVNHRQNDGDSFRVQLPGGRTEEFRLYFVDCPESEFRTYGGGATNRERIDEQAKYFNITAEQAVGIGDKAKHYTLDLLGRQPFTVYTFWEDHFHDHRMSAIIQSGNGEWLHRNLVREGYSRIFTKPSEMPDGTPAKEEVGMLRQMEEQAKAARKGAWGLSR